MASAGWPGVHKAPLVLQHQSLFSEGKTSLKTLFLLLTLALFFLKQNNKKKTQTAQSKVTRDEFSVNLEHFSSDRNNPSIWIYVIPSQCQAAASSLCQVLMFGARRKPANRSRNPDAWWGARKELHPVRVVLATLFSNIRLNKWNTVSIFNRVGEDQIQGTRHILQQSKYFWWQLIIIGLLITTQLSMSISFLSATKNAIFSLEVSH